MYYVPDIYYFTWDRLEGRDTNGSVCAFVNVFVVNLMSIGGFKRWYVTPNSRIRLNDVTIISSPIFLYFIFIFLFDLHLKG